ncbi:SAGA-associated factor 29 [Trichomonascus vanleenenianus]|uniref:Sgf29p n=1 Tax=Trichomonascus vanleenenianus TaxID=2268995 RepID=UPI003ECA3030
MARGRSSRSSTAHKLRGTDASKKSPPVDSHQLWSAVIQAVQHASNLSKNESPQRAITQAIEQLSVPDIEDDDGREQIEEDLETYEPQVGSLIELFEQEKEVRSEEHALLDRALSNVTKILNLRLEEVTQHPLKKKRKVDSSGRGGIRVGSQVAFRMSGPGAAEEEWIQCEVTAIDTSSEPTRYTVRDPEPDDHGNPGQSYTATRKSLIPISPSDAAVEVTFSAGDTVLARYPETTTFYRAEVVGTKRDGTCRLIFEGEEEEGKETEVESRLVLPIPTK